IKSQARPVDPCDAMASPSTSVGGAGVPPSRPGARAPRSPTWLRLGLALLVMVGGTVAGASRALSSGVSGARTDLQQARTQLRELDVRLSLIAEQIHQGKVLLGTL